MAGIGLMVAKSLPPPGKLGKMKPDNAAEDAVDGGADDSEEGDQNAAKLGAAEAFQEATKNGTAEDVLSAFEDLIGVCKGY